MPAAAPDPDPASSSPSTARAGMWEREVASLAPSSAGCTRRPAANTALISTPSAVCAIRWAHATLKLVAFCTLLVSFCTLPDQRVRCAQYLSAFPVRVGRKGDTSCPQQSELSLSSQTRTRQHHQEAGAAHRAAQESEERWRRRCSGPRLRCDNQQTVLCRHARCVQRTLLGLLQRLNRSMREPSTSAQEHSHMRAFPTRRHSTKSTHKHTALRGDGFG